MNTKLAIVPLSDPVSGGLEVSSPLRKRTLDDLKNVQSARSCLAMPVLVLLENIRSLFNVGSFFRTADGAGAQGVVLCGYTAHPPRAEISKVALGAETTVPWEHFRDPLAAARAVKARGYRLLAVEQTTGGVDLHATRLPFPCCLVFGHEVDGVSDALLSVCDGAVEVAMHGGKESLNVAVCGGVVLFEARRQFETSLRRAAAPASGVHPSPQPSPSGPPLGRRAMRRSV